MGFDFRKCENLGLCPRFSTLDLANVNEWKIMFDPSIIIINKVPRYALKTLGITLNFQTEGDTSGFQIFTGSWFGLFDA